MFEPIGCLAAASLSHNSVLKYQRPVGSSQSRDGSLVHNNKQCFPQELWQLSEYIEDHTYFRR